VTGEGDDDLHPGRKTFSLSFELPRGSYATIVVKRLMLL
jgi:tRNA pseudouridine13 synthase